MRRVSQVADRLKTYNLRNLGKRKRNPENWVDTQAIIQSPLQKLIIGNSGQTCAKADNQIFLVRPNFA